MGDQEEERYDYRNEPFGLKEYITDNQLYLSDNGEMLNIPSRFAWVSNSHYGWPYYSTTCPRTWKKQQWILATHKRTGENVHLFFKDTGAVQLVPDGGAKPDWTHFHIKDGYNKVRVNRSDYEPYCFPPDMQRYAKRFLRQQGVPVKTFLCEMKISI